VIANTFTDVHYRSTRYCPFFSQLHESLSSSYALSMHLLNYLPSFSISIRGPFLNVSKNNALVSFGQEIARLQKVQGPSALSARGEMARLSRHLGSLPLLAKHRINCLRTAIKRNMEVQNFAYAKQMLELLLSKAPPSKQDELRSLINMCVHRGLSNKSIDPLEDPSQFCAATLSRLSTKSDTMCVISAEPNFRLSLHLDA